MISFFGSHTVLPGIKKPFWLERAETFLEGETTPKTKHKQLPSIYIYIWYPPPKTHTFSEFTGICAILLFFTMFKCLFFLASILYVQKVV